LSFELASVGELDPDFRGALDHVQVGEDIAFFVDKDAGPEAETGAAGAVAVVVAPELTKEVSEGVAVFNDFFRGDVDDGGHDAFDRLDHDIAAWVRVRSWSREGSEGEAEGEGGESRPRKEISRASDGVIGGERLASG
jgi:hypothetical protein